LVVVVPVQAVPSEVGQADLPALEGPLQGDEVERTHVPLVPSLVQLDVVELEDHVKLPAGRVGEQARLLHRRPWRLADGEQRVLPSGEHLAVHLLKELVQPRAVGVQRLRVGMQGEGCVGEVDRLGDEVDDVHPEAVDTSVEPPTHHPVDLLAEVGVLPVQVGCFREKMCR
jgi:hypothetical protein